MTASGLAVVAQSSPVAVPGVAGTPLTRAPRATLLPSRLPSLGSRGWQPGQSGWGMQKKVASRNK
jgi:hypothetical protein